MSIISVSEIRKSYGRTEALRGVSFTTKEGEIFGLIGPDGAGKTSLLRILATLLLPDSGKASVNGFDVVKDFKVIRRDIGYMPERFSLYQDMTVEENLSFFATVFGTTIERNYYLVEDIYKQIAPFKNRHAGKLSGGMKQKLALSCALIHAPRILFLDDPTTGVDPVSRKEFWETLQKLRNDFGLGIIVSTPYMDEATRCDRIALMQGGRFLTIDTPGNIANNYNKTLWTVSSDNMHRLLNDLRNMIGIKTAFAFGEAHHATVDKNAITINELKERLTALGHLNVVVKKVTPSVEDCFMSLQS